MFAIAGVSGHTGSVVADTLLAQGHPVRVIVRDAAKAAAWKAKGAEVAVADLADTAALTRALSGVAGAYLLLPPNMATQTPLEDNARLSAGYATAAKAAKVPHVVFLSSIGAQHATGTGPIRAAHRAEADLAATGIPVTFVRAAYFMENWANSLGALAQHILPTFIPAGFRHAQVATRDIGKTAAAALVEGHRAGVQIIELSGPREFSAADAAEILSQQLGTKIAPAEGPLSAVVPTFTGFGIAAPVAELFREMYEGVASGRVAWEGGKARAVRGAVELADTLAQLRG